MVPLVELVNRHSSKASALSYRHILLLVFFFVVVFFISDEVTSFCLQAIVLGNFQSRRA